jgi:hypothetical protein
MYAGELVVRSRRAALQLVVATLRRLCARMENFGLTNGSNFFSGGHFAQQSEVRPINLVGDHGWSFDLRPVFQHTQSMV